MHTCVLPTHLVWALMDCCACQHAGQKTEGTCDEGFFLDIESL